MSAAVTAGPRTGAALGSRRRLVVLAAVLAAVLVALAGFAVGHRSGATAPTTGTPQPGAADVGFSQDMAVHHDQALLMADLAVSRGGPAVRGIANTILTSQAQEAGQLRGWLQLWGRPATDAHPMAWMGGSGHGAPTASAGHLMPGMATPQQLTTLYSSSGRRFDDQFLRLMIAHHRGGIAMARAAQRRADLPPVRYAARAMQVEQAQDIAQMSALLGAGA